VLEAVRNKGWRRSRAARTAARVVLVSRRTPSGEVDILIVGRNLDLRRRIAGSQRMIEEHENKIRRERIKTQPDEDLIAHWQHEIEVRKQQVVRLSAVLDENGRSHDYSKKNSAGA